MVGAASNNRVFLKELRHAEHRLQAREYKMSHAVLNNE